MKANKRSLAEGRFLTEEEVLQARAEVQHLLDELEAYYPDASPNGKRVVKEQLRRMAALAEKECGASIRATLARIGGY